MQSIETTEFEENFDKNMASKVMLLSSDEASEVFGDFFGRNARSYQTFADDHWCVSSQHNNLGDWIEAYNADKNEPVSQVLKMAVKWDGASAVYFCISRLLVLRTSWDDFVANWDCFIACEDDFPILVNTKHKGEAVMFTPMGEIRYIHG